jgi:predicted TIM-barrel fold metal-dependent hydrolase
MTATYPTALVQSMASHGRKKVLFGTHWPMIAPEHALGLDPEARALFLADNARRVFRLP